MKPRKYKKIVKMVEKMMEMLNDVHSVNTRRDLKDKLRSFQNILSKKEIEITTVGENKIYIFYQ